MMMLAVVCLIIDKDIAFCRLGLLRGDRMVTWIADSVPDMQCAALYQFGQCVCVPKLRAVLAGCAQQLERRSATTYSSFHRICGLH